MRVRDSPLPRQVSVDGFVCITQCCQFNPGYEQRESKKQVQDYPPSIMKILESNDINLA